MRCPNPKENINTIFICLTISLHRPVKDMIEEIKSGISVSFGSEKLRELCKLLPDEGEVLISAAFFFPSVFNLVAFNFTS